jgi:hypothetical protein
MAVELSAEDWKRYTIKEGTKGPISADFAFVRVVRKHHRRPGHEVWVVFRRSTSAPTEIKSYLSNAPAETAKTDLVRQAGLRWPVCHDEMNGYNSGNPEIEGEFLRIIREDIARGRRLRLGPRQSLDQDPVGKGNLSLPTLTLYPLALLILWSATP